MIPEYELRLEVAAMPKARPRFGRGRAYMDSDYEAWKAGVAQEARLRGVPLLDEPLSLSVALSRRSTLIRVSTLDHLPNNRRGTLTGDVDNYAGGIMDALEGVAWVNDRQINELTVRLER